MDRTYFVGQSVMSQSRTRNNARIVYGSLAGLTAALLAAAFISPFYGALDGPVPVTVSGNGANAANSGSGIVVEQFDYDEPDANAGSADAQAQTPPAQEQRNAPVGNAGAQEGALQREAPRPPLSDLGLAATPKPPEPPAPAAPVAEDEGMQLLQRPVAIAAGRFESQGRQIDLQGIGITPVDQTCRTASGESWPCGMQARTAFRQWLRSRAVMCRLPQNDSGGAVATACKLGNEDAAGWLVTNGWAKAAPDGPYADAGRKAEDAHMGIFGDKPDTALPELAPNPGPDTGTGTGPDSGLDNGLNLEPDTGDMPGVSSPPPQEPQPSAPSPSQGEFPPAPAN